MLDQPVPPFPDRQVFAAWADHLLGDPARTAHAASLVAPEPWIVLECASATRQHSAELGRDGWRILAERHLPSLGRGHKVHLMFAPESATTLEAVEREGVLFEFKVAWAESFETLKETAAGVRSDARSRARLPNVYSAMPAFAFEWPSASEPPLFRWPPSRTRRPCRR